MVPAWRCSDVVLYQGREGKRKREREHLTYQNGAYRESSHQTCHVPPEERLQSRGREEGRNKEEWEDWREGEEPAAAAAAGQD